MSRLIAVLAEQRHDDKGLNWPMEVAPFKVHVVCANKDEAAAAAAEELAQALDEAGVEVLLDDRPEVSPGVKFKDAELLGMPLVAILGRGFVDGTIEIRERGGEIREVSAAEALEVLREAVAQG